MLRTESHRKYRSTNRHAMDRLLKISLCWAVLCATWALPAVAMPDIFGMSFAHGDFDGDGFDDLAVGAPGQANNGGGVEVYYGTSAGLNGSSQNWNQDVAGILGLVEADDYFGQAVASGDFNGDGYSDLAVGVPGEDIGTIADAGAINVIYGSAAGLTATGNDLWHQDSPAISGMSEAGDRFGFSLASGDFDGDGFGDLAIGVPFEDVGVISETGIVNVIYGSASGLASQGNTMWFQDQPGMRDIDEPGDEFGWSLAAGDMDRDGYDDLAIGVPGETFESKGSDGQQAGRISLMFGGSSGLSSQRNDVFHLDRGNIQGIASQLDRYGTSVAVGDFNGDGTDDLAVGAPGEDLGAINAGAVNVLYFFQNQPGSYATQTFTQDSNFMLGTAENGDNFGYALAVGNFDGDGRDDLAIGVATESLGSVSCGIAQVIYSSTSGLVATHNELWHQDSPGILDQCEISDQAGRALGVGDFDNDGFDELVIGVPQEDSLAGLANVILGSSSGLTSTGNLTLP